MRRRSQMCEWMRSGKSFRRICPVTEKKKNENTYVSGISDTLCMCSVKSLWKFNQIVFPGSFMCVCPLSTRCARWPNSMCMWERERWKGVNIPIPGVNKVKNHSRVIYRDWVCIVSTRSFSGALTPTEAPGHNWPLCRVRELGSQINRSHAQGVFQRLSVRKLVIFSVHFFCACGLLYRTSGRSVCGRI